MDVNYVRWLLQVAEQELLTWSFEQTKEPVVKR